MLIDPLVGLRKAVVVLVGDDQRGLADFVIRVANGKATSETEVEVLSEVARVVVAYLSSSF